MLSTSIFLGTNTGQIVAELDISVSFIAGRRRVDAGGGSA